MTKDIREGRRGRKRVYKEKMEKENVSEGVKEERTVYTADTGMTNVRGFSLGRFCSLMST